MARWLAGLSDWKMSGFHFQIPVSLSDYLILWLLRLHNPGDCKTKSSSHIIFVAIIIKKSTNVHGLAKCIKADSSLSLPERMRWEAAKTRGHVLFDPAKGGRYEVFNERPLKDELTTYCAQDVQYLPSLYRVYAKTLESAGYLRWEDQVRSKTRQRLVESMSETYQPHGHYKAIAPE